MREADAKEKWCPFARVNMGNNRVQVERQDEAALRRMDQYMSASTRCRGSDCMTWRWTRAPMTGVEGEGYCGLAGGQ